MESNAFRLGLDDFAFVNQLTQSDSIDQLRRIAGNFGQFLGFERWIYGIAGPNTVIADKYPEDWIAGYVRDRLHRGTDPILHAVGERRFAIHWDLRRTEPFGKPLISEQRAILASRWHFGARHGITAPVYDAPHQLLDFGVFSFTRELPLTSVEQAHHAPRVQLFAIYFHNVAAELMLGGLARAPYAPLLAPREYDCLSWAALGKSNWEIGRLIGISQATVAFHLSNAARKLRVRGRVAAIAKAMRFKLIDPC